MAYVPPVGVINANWPADAYAGARSTITGSWASGQHVAPVGIGVPDSASPVLTWQQFIAPDGLSGEAYGSHQAGAAESYFTPQYQVLATWQGADAYGTPSSPINGSWSTSQREIAAAGIDAPDVPAPVLLWTQFIAPDGLYRGEFGDPYTLHDYEYAHPEWSIVASWVGAAAYTPPASEIHGQWRKDFGPKDIAPLGYDGSVVPDPTATLMRAYVEPAGHQHAEFGLTQIRNGASGISAPGIAARLVFGTPTLDLHTRYIEPNGFYRGTYGRPKVELYRAYLRPSGFDPSAYGVATLSGGLRTISLGGRGIVAGAAGRPTVTFRERLVNTVGWDARELGMPMLGFHTEIQPEGLDSARFGTTEVRDNSQRTYVTGRRHDEHGEPLIAMRVRTLVQLPTISPGGFGITDFRNHRRYVETYSERGDWGPFFGNFAPYVSNRNRTIATYGHASSRFSLAAAIENAAVPLRPRPLDAADFGDALVAYGIRHLQVGGWDASVLSRWSTIINAARVLRPTSVSGQAMLGLPHLANTRRFVTWAGGADAALFGVAYADYRVRTLAQILPVRPLYVPLPTVFLKQRFVLPSSFGGVQLGMPHAEERFTRFYPRWVFVEQMGNPTLVNRNRSVGSYGYDLAEYGRATVYRYVQEIQVEGAEFMALGRARIADSLQAVKPVGVLVFRIGNGTRVQLYQPDLPYARTLFPGSIVVSVRYGTPKLQGNSIYPYGIESAMRGGTPLVVSMGISPKGIFLPEEEKYGRPLLNFDQYLYPSPIAAPINTQRHRLDPHTIWATEDTPTQASQNHDGSGFRPIDWLRGIGVGRPSLYMAIPLELRTQGSPMSRMGTPRLDLRRRYVSPVGFNTFRYGWPRLPGTITCIAVGFSIGGIGRPDVARYVDPQQPRAL
ncbi:MAG TPA: hypothetical protein DCR72_12485, partial [Pseudomonas sp.]|nr:hypothetical protein [Pseudomonas sp.]